MICKYSSDEGTISANGRETVIITTHVHGSWCSMVRGGGVEMLVAGSYARVGAFSARGGVSFYIYIYNICFNIIIQYHNNNIKAKGTDSKAGPGPPERAYLWCRVPARAAKDAVVVRGFRGTRLGGGGGGRARKTGAETAGEGREGGRHRIIFAFGRRRRRRHMFSSRSSVGSGTRPRAYTCSVASPVSAAYRTYVRPTDHTANRAMITPPAQHQ